MVQACLIACRRLALCAAMLACWNAAGARANDARPVLARTGCWFEAPSSLRVACYRLTVPETRGKAGTKQLSLPVVIVHGHNWTALARALPDPVVYLAGGPGDGAWLDPERIGWWWDFIKESPWLARRDLVLFDQRGSGLVEPRIDCPELERLAVTLLQETDPVKAVALQAGAARDCAARLVREGHDPRAYTSFDSAADLHDLFLALGARAWDVYGVSYGTRLALEYMRRFPDDLRAAILDSVLPPEAPYFEDDAAHIDRALRALFTACARDPGCRKQYGDLEQRLRLLVDRLDREPMVVRRPDPAGGPDISVTINGSLLINDLFSMFYNVSTIRGLPRVIDIYDRGLQDGIGTDMDGYISNFLGRADFGDAMYLSAHCEEEVPYNDVARTIAAYARYPLLKNLAAGGADASFAAICRGWEAGLASVPKRRPSDNEAVHSGIPALVLSGLFDPVTPPAYGRMAAANLVNSFYFEFPGIGHDALGNDYCPNEIAARFLDDPATPPSDPCLGDPLPVRFDPPVE